MKEQLLKIINHPSRNVVVAGVAAFAGGTGFGYFLGRRKSTTYGVYEIPDSQLTLDLDDDDLVGRGESGPAPVVIDAEAYEEINKGRSLVEDMLENIHPPHVMRSDTIEFEDDARQPQTLEDLRFHEVSINLEGDGQIEVVGPVEEDEEPEVVHQSVFAGNDETWDYKAELLARAESRELPYVIHKDEFFGQENDYAQITLTYFEGDNIMCDEEEIPVYNYQTVVGELKFGHGSGDPNVFYVRNDKRQAEYEILRHEGQFLVEVGGADPHESERARGLQHSGTKFRMD